MQSIGGVYDKYFLWYDDVDTTFRLSTAYGIGYLVTGAKVNHSYLAQSRIPYWKQLLESRNRIIFIYRNGPLLTRFRILISGLRMSLRTEIRLRVRIAGIRQLLLAFVGKERYFDPVEFQ